MSTPRTGERIRYLDRERTWKGRIREGGKRSAWTDLCTADEALAQERYDRWLMTGEAPSQKGKETFEHAATRIVDVQAERGEKGVKDRRARLRDFAFPRIGSVEVGRLEGHHVARVLDAMVDEDGRLSGTVLKMRSDISRVLTALVREGALGHNVAIGVELPDNALVDDRPRIVLTDDEILRFRRRGFESELDMMALFARDLAGHRTSDLHAADWSHFDTATWRTALVRRPKTDGDGRRKKERAGARRASRAYERVVHAIPATVRAPLIAWWTAQGSPMAGPVFPLRKGPKAGQRKTGKGISYAEPLRAALWAEGITRPLPGFETATGDERRKFCALQVDTEETRAVDFHSFRRAYVTALADAGVNMQTALDLSGHTQETTSHRYRGPRLIETPAGALPGGQRKALPVAQPDPSPPPVAQNPAPDMATIAALLAQVAGALGGQAKGLDPDSGSKAGVTKLRVIPGNRRK
jgi:hypothetical protein